MEKNSPTAILLFARLGRNESRHKKVYGHSSSNTKLWDELLRTTKAKVRRAGMDYFHYDESRQQGTNFGERISHAVGEVFNRGYKRIIIIGNDCPDLTTEDIRDTHTLLDDHSLVIGKDHRGGAYLIGLQSQDYDSAIFAGMPWRSPKLAEALMASAAGAYAELKSKQDLNAYCDFQDLRKSSTLIIAVIRSITRQEHTANRPYPDRTSLAILQRHALRGPPIGSRP